MKKVNFNALQNFEVPESWIEKAINAKPAAPKKKPIYLSSRYISTAASVVLAVGITVFSPLFLNRGITLPVKDVFATSSAASAPQQDTTPGTTQASGITPTLPPAATKGTEASAPSATGNTQNEQTSTERPGSQTGNPSTQPTVNSEQTNTPSGQPEQTVQPRTSEPYHHIIQPQTMPQKPTNPEPETKTTEPVQDSTGATEGTEATEPTGSLKEITTKWIINYSFLSDFGASESIAAEGTEEEILCGEFFSNDIKISFPDAINKLKRIDCVITIKNTDIETITGTLKFGFKDPINECITDGNGIYKINLSKLPQKSIDIPCGEYKIDFSCYDLYDNQIYFKSKDLLLNNQPDPVELVPSSW